MFKNSITIVNNEIIEKINKGFLSSNDFIQFLKSNYAFMFTNSDRFKNLSDYGIKEAFFERCDKGYNFIFYTEIELLQAQKTPCNIKSNKDYQNYIDGIFSEYESGQVQKVKDFTCNFFGLSKYFNNRDKIKKVADKLIKRGYINYWDAGKGKGKYWTNPLVTHNDIINVLLKTKEV